MTRLGIFSWFAYPMPIEDKFRKIKLAGFDSTFLWWDGEEQDNQPELARKCGLGIENIHAPFHNADSLWADNLTGEGYYDVLAGCVRSCKRHEIPIVVVHTTAFDKHAPISEVGMRRVSKLMDLGEQMDVCIALENLSYLENLDYIFEHIDSPRLGFCYDSGHENNWHPDADCLARYGHRLLAIHLHDNFGDGDAHLLPYDGTIDWSKVKKGLRASRDTGCITLEADFDRNHPKSAIYKGLSADEYLALAYERATRLLNEP